MTKSKDPSKKQSAASPADNTPSKKKSLSDIECYTYGEFGHYARDCKDRKSKDKALVAGEGKADSSDEESYDNEVAYVTTSEIVLFSRDDVLLDSQDSVNVFCNPLSLTNVRKSDRQVVLNGVQSKADGVKITLEGDFGDDGKV